MPLSDYQKYFAEKHQGPLHSVTVLSHPIQPRHDVKISDDNQDVIRDAVIKAEKYQNSLLVFHGKLSSKKARQINKIAYKIQQPLCIVSCSSFASYYMEETEKKLSLLLATAQTKNWILYLDEADALFNKMMSAIDSDNEQNFSYLLDRLSQYSGMVVLSINEEVYLEKIKYRVQKVITFH